MVDVTAKNWLIYGDNLDMLRKHVPDESVDLVYLDPPFNSNRSYNVLFKDRTGEESVAQMQAFDDTWRWGPNVEAQYEELLGADLAIADAMHAMRTLLHGSDVMAYLVMMTARLVELHRVLKRDGSLYLHCDPTASHYLKIVLDGIFGAANFRNEITWLRTTTHNDAKRWSPNSDTILYYGKSGDVTWNPVHLPHGREYVESKYRHVDVDGRRYRLDNMTSPNPRPNLTYEWKGHTPPAKGWRYSRETMAKLDADGRIWYPDAKSKRPQLKRYLDEQPGPVCGDVWSDISPVNSRAAERLGYPTQKPLPLLERIIAASSNPGDVVLDPFCGCGTAVDAAHRLGRRWVGIDVTYLAIDVIQRRLIDAYKHGVIDDYDVIGIPRDIPGAQNLADRDAFEFERWAVLQVSGVPNKRRDQQGDKGIDGVIRFPTGNSHNDRGRILVSVKSGKQLGPAMVRDLRGTIEREKAEMGMLISLHEPTKGMLAEARAAGTYTNPLTGQEYPRLQVVTIREVLAGGQLNAPGAIDPVLNVMPADPNQLTLDVAV